MLTCQPDRGREITKHALHLLNHVEANLKNDLFIDVDHLDIGIGAYALCDSVVAGTLV
jgi:hypothetical protein